MANDEPKPPPVPSPVAREMMRALSDRMMFTAPVAAELVVASVRKSLDALIAGDLVAYTIEGFALTDALEGVRRAMGDSIATMKAIESLDPSYFAAANNATRSVAIRDYRRRFVGRSELDVIKAYASHVLRCDHASACIETAAILEELKSRGLEVPSELGGRRS